MRAFYTSAFLRLGTITTFFPELRRILGNRIYILIVLSAGISGSRRFSDVILRLNVLGLFVKFFVIIK